MKAFHAKLLDAKLDVEFEIRRRAPQEQVLRSLSQDDADLAITVVGFRYQAVLNHCRFGKDSLVVFYDPEVREPINTVQEYVDGRHGVVSIGTQSKSAVARTLSELGVKRKVSLIAPTASMLGGLIMGTDIVATLPRRLAKAAYAGLVVAPRRLICLPLSITLCGIADKSSPAATHGCGNRCLQGVEWYARCRSRLTPRPSGRTMPEMFRARGLNGERFFRSTTGEFIL